MVCHLPEHPRVRIGGHYGQGGNPLDVTLPDSYPLSQLCGLLRLTVNAIPKETSYLKMDFHQFVAGIFSIPTPVYGDGTSTIAIGDAGGSNATVIPVTDFPDSAEATYTLNNI